MDLVERHERLLKLAGFSDLFADEAFFLLLGGEMDGVVLRESQ